MELIKSLGKGFKVCILTFLLIVSAILTCSSSAELLVYSTAVSGVSRNTDLSFSVISDIHTNTSNMDQAIKELYRINPNSDAVILNGDTVDQGLETQYTSVKASLSKNKNLLPGIVIKNIGNHEFFNYDNGPLLEDQVKTYINRYLDFSGEKRVYHDTWIKGYHFISLGSESGSTKELGAVKAYISEEQLKWFKEKLEENHVKGKPMFVFLHQHLSSIMKGWVGTDQAGKIDGILAKYPEVVVFTSHTHVSLAVNNVFTDKPYTIVHTGGITYQLSIDGKGGRVREEGNQGIYVEVKGNKVTVRGREFKERKWMFEKQLVMSN